MVCVKCGFNMEGAAPGRKLIKIIGILYIVFAVIGISSLIFIFTDVDLDMVEITGLTIALSIVIMIVEIVVGIFGIKYCGSPEKAKFLKTLAIIVIANTIASIIYNSTISISSFSWFPFFESLFGLVLPILFLIGVLKNLNVKGGE